MRGWQIAFLALILVSGCGKSNFQGKETSSNVFRQAMSSDVTTLDPARIQDVDTMDLHTNIYEGLVAYDVQNVIVGRVADKWDSPDGGKTWIFHIRDGVRFHNGRVVTADDVVWSIQRALSDKVKSPTASSYLNDIKSVSATDAQHVTFSLDAPRAYFIGKLTYACAFVLAKEAVGDKDITEVSQAVGTGPFKLKSIVPGQQVIVERWDDYYLTKANVSRVERVIILDASTRLNKYRAGELDSMNLDHSQLPGVETDPALAPQLSYRLRPAVNYIGLNQAAAPVLRDERVRKAIAMALDRTKLCRDLLHNVPPANTLIGPGVPGYRKEYSGLPFDPAGAAKLLAEAGYPGGRGFPELTITVREKTPDSLIVGESVQTQLRRNLRITVKPKVLQWGTLLNERNENRLQLYFLSWYADYLDAQNFLSLLLRSGAPNNHDGFSNATFDKMVDEADSITDEKRRVALYQKAEDLVVLSGARIPLFFQQDAVLVNPRVKGLDFNLMGNLPPTRVTLK